MFLDLNIFGHRNQGKNHGNFEVKVDEAILLVMQPPKPTYSTISEWTLLRNQFI